MRTLIQLVIALILAAVAWALLGYLLTAPLGAIYGWGGHPAMPAAAWNVYVILYFVLLPVVCLALGWYVGGWVIRAAARRTS